MADRIALSLWLGTSEHQPGLGKLGQALRLFPFSPRQPGVRALIVTPLTWSEPCLHDERFEPGLAVETAMRTLAEFAHDDYAFEVEAAWDLWAPAGAGGATAEEWKQEPAPVRFLLIGREFDPADREEGDLSIDFGPEAWFLGSHSLPETPVGSWPSKLRANTAQLARYTQAVQAALSPQRRRLWSESEVSLASRLADSLQWLQ